MMALPMPFWPCFCTFADDLALDLALDVRKALEEGICAGVASLWCVGGLGFGALEGCIAG